MKTAELLDILDGWSLELYLLSHSVAQGWTTLEWGFCAWLRVACWSVHIPASVLHAIFVLTLATCDTVQSFVVVEDLIVTVFYVSVHDQVHLWVSCLWRQEEGTGSSELVFLIYMGIGNLSWVFFKSSKCSWLLSHLPSPNTGLSLRTSFSFFFF